jgi:hypothetical protein
VNPNLNPDPANPLNWHASTAIGGSPGADDAPANIPRVFINEALTHTDPPQLDTIELNPNPTNVNIGNWYLTDQRIRRRNSAFPPTQPSRQRLPEFHPEDWNQHRLRRTASASIHGEQIYLYSATPTAL